MGLGHCILLQTSAPFQVFQNWRGEFEETGPLATPVQEALESAIAEFEKRQQAKQERLRERERFETDWARIRTAVLPALEEVAVLLRKAGWQCEVRAGDKDLGVHFTVYRGATAGGKRANATTAAE
jgi:hypothetical protein